MKLPAKPPTKVDRVKAALYKTGHQVLTFEKAGLSPDWIEWQGSISELAAELLGPDPVIMPSTEAMAAHMDEFYADSILDNAGVPTG